MTESGYCLRCRGRRVLPLPCPSCGYHGYTLEEWLQAEPSLAPGLTTVAGLLRQGEKILAVKAMRELTGSGLKEAKDAVDAFAVGGRVDLPVRVMPPTVPDWREVPDGARPELVPARLRDLCAQGRKIEAIKLAREATGMGLAEAKAYVESVERAAPPGLALPPAPTIPAAPVIPSPPAMSGPVKPSPPTIPGAPQMPTAPTLTDLGRPPDAASTGAPVMPSVPTIPATVPAPQRPLGPPPVVGADAARPWSPLALLLGAAVAVALLGLALGWFK